MIRFIILISGFLSISALNSQIGFLNKKNIFEAHVSYNAPYLSGYFNDGIYKVSDGKMKKTKDLLDIGVSLNYLRVIKDNFSLGVLVSMKNFDVSLPKTYFTSYSFDENQDSFDSIGLRTESLKYTNYYFAPHFEYSTKEGFTGVGLSYDLAIGISLSNLRNDKYAYSINELSTNNDSDENWTKIDYYESNLQWKKYLGIFVQTGFNIRLPLTNQVLIKTGLHYTFIYNIRPNSYDMSNLDQAIFNNEDVFFQVQRKNLASITFDVGLSYFF